MIPGMAGEEWDPRVGEAAYGWQHPPSEASTVFGSRLGPAEHYASLLAGHGLERGLLGPREVDRLWERHLLNCAVVGELIPRDARVVDIGSGAGLPGLVLAIGRPDLEITLVDSRLRPTVFLSECVDALGLTSVSVRRARAADLAGTVVADIVTARAVSSLARLAEWSLPLLASGGELLAVKGETAGRELADAWARLRELGADGGRVVRAGEGTIRDPAIVVRVTARARAQQRHNRHRHRRR